MISNYTNTINEINIIDKRIEIIEVTLESLKQEKENLEQLEEYLEQSLSMIERHLKELVGIENALYYEIIVNDLNPTKAVDRVSFKYNKDISTIWKNYYPKVKDKIIELQNINNNL